ncbi:hypothetical protein NQ318_022766 [Aromia moschata]|uniref:C2H2-type domain-containing protein n=1 Tax=Aromia moschata TaxID=1265417 RepID=A0AAV8YFP4_9CUCU|nr:hypothetical protein NQ318_022766 [Aromia moschata]
MRTHNGDRPYECSLCNYAFTTKANCERHLRNRHAKTTREEVKKSIIYHPSEDPTNEDLNKLTSNKEEPKKSIISSPTEPRDLTPDKIHCSTPKMSEMVRSTFSEMKSDGKLHTPNIALPALQSLKATKMFSNIDVIRNDNIRSLKEHKLIHNGAPPPVFQPNFGFSPQKIQVKSLETLKDSSTYNNESEEEFIEEEEQPMDLVLDLSKKKTQEDVNCNQEDLPQDLTKKTPPPQIPPNMSEVFAQQLLKTPPKIDPAALYATQLAHLYRSGFPALSNWTGFPLNPLLFPTISPTLPQSPQDIKERMQRFQLCGGSMIAEDLKKPSKFPKSTTANASQLTSEL